MAGYIARSSSSLPGPSSNPFLRSRALSELQKGLTKYGHAPKRGGVGRSFDLPAPARRTPMAYNIYGDQIPDEYGAAPRRRRGRGITARDLRSFRRVANLIRKYAAPVRHFRKHPKGGTR